MHSHKLTHTIPWVIVCSLLNEHSTLHVVLVSNKHINLSGYFYDVVGTRKRITLLANFAMWDSALYSWSIDRVRCCTHYSALACTCWKESKRLYCFAPTFGIYVVAAINVGIDRYTQKCIQGLWQFLRPDVHIATKDYVYDVLTINV